MPRTAWEGVFGLACNSSAAAPATCADAIDVPPNVLYAPLSSAHVERMRPPGAPRSGLSVRSAAVPYALGPEMRPPNGFTGVRSPRQVSETGPPTSLLWMTSPSACPTSTAGIEPCVTFGDKGAVPGVL